MAPLERLPCSPQPYGGVAFRIYESYFCLVEELGSCRVGGKTSDLENDGGPPPLRSAFKFCLQFRINDIIDFLAILHIKCPVPPRSPKLIKRRPLID